MSGEQSMVQFVSRMIIAGTVVSAVVVALSAVISEIVTYWRYYPSKYISVLKKTDILFHDIIGCDNIKNDLKLCIKLLQNKVPDGELLKYIPKGYVFQGRTGTGKTYMARALANEANVPFIQIDFTSFYTNNENYIRNILKYTVNKYSPCIIFIDDIHKLQSSSMIVTMLEFLDGMISQDKQVILIATTTEPLEPELVRSGRLDKVINFSKPTKSERKGLFNKYLNDYQTESIDVERLIEKTGGLTASDIRTICHDAKFISLKNDHAQIIQNDIDDAINKIKMGNFTHGNESDADFKMLVSYHEAAHFLISYILKSKQKPTDISIKRVGNVEGVVHLSSDKIYYSKSDVYKNMMVSLASLCGEKRIIGEHTLGCSSDITNFNNLFANMCDSLMVDELLDDNLYVNPESSCSSSYPIKQQIIKNKIFNKLIKNIEIILNMHADTFLKIINYINEHETCTCHTIESLIDTSIKNSIDLNNKMELLF